jgi:SAM-dependent methyltransferase
VDHRFGAKFHTDWVKVLLLWYAAAVTDDSGDVLDLHTFSPAEVGTLIVDYLEQALERGYAHVRIIHGKGTGVLRERVHAILSHHEGVADFALGGPDAGGWGATTVRLRRLCRSAPAAQRNREPLHQVLRGILPERGLVLEVASGSGEHAVYFAERFPELIWQPSDPDVESRRSCGGYLGESGLSNLRPPLALDVMDWPWAIDAADAVVCINMIHIAPWQACVKLFEGAGRLLQPGGVAVLYGPYRVAGTETAASNEAFDRSLKSRNPEWGLRDLEDVQEVARKSGLHLESRLQMPANNLTVVFRRQ